MVEVTDAAVLWEIDKPLKLMTLELPPLSPGQVLVQVCFSGICRSQLLEIHGARGEDRFLPHTLGHEGSGIVKAVGSGVSKVKPGDKVVLSWIKGDGAEVSSTKYGSTEGEINSGAISTFMRMCVTCENRVVPIPDVMPLREAALLGCAIPTGVGAVINTAALEPGGSVVVFGVGGVGYSAILGAMLKKAAPIIAVDVNTAKLEQARMLGVDHTVNSMAEDPVKAVMDITEGKGVDCAIEAAGCKESMEEAFACTRGGGGVCVLAGNLQKGDRISLDPFDLIKGKRIVGTWGGSTLADRDIPAYVEHYLNGNLDLSSLSSRTYSLTEINKALGDFEEGKILRGIIDMSL